MIIKRDCLNYILISDLKTFELSTYAGNLHTQALSPQEKILFEDLFREMKGMEKVVVSDLDVNMILDFDYLLLIMYLNTLRVKLVNFCFAVW